MEIYPIWKTIEVDLTSKLTDGAVEYYVYVGGMDRTLVYEGRAYADANGNCKVTLNDIIKDYLGTAGDPDITEELWDADNALVEVYVEADDTGPTFLVLNDWSYDKAYSWDEDIAQDLGDRVIEKIETGIPFPLTVINATGYTFARNGVTVVSGTLEGYSNTLFLPVGLAGEYELELEGSDGTEIYNFTAVDACRKGHILYRNAIGGFDLLPIDSIVENDAYKRDNYEIAGDNADRDKHLRRDYRNAVTKTYTLRTPVLTDDEASRMHNVLGTVQAWLITPERGYDAVSMKANGWKRKTFKNEGRKRVVYEFDVEVAQPMERR